MERNKRYLICAKLAEQLPEDRVVFVDRDHYSVALVSGRATITTSHWEGRHISPNSFLDSGGQGVAFWKRRSIESKHLIDYLLIRDSERSLWEHRVHSKIVTINDLEFLVGTVGYPLDSVPTFISQREYGQIPTGIHPRRLSLTKADSQAARLTSLPVLD